MGIRDERHKFDEIVAGIEAEDPGFGDVRAGGWSRPVRTALIILAAVTWGGLSILMVVWGWIGVLIAGGVIAAAATFGWRHYRCRR